MALSPTPTRPSGRVRLVLPAEAAELSGCLSAVEQVGFSLWLVGDEAASLNRLMAVDAGNFAQHQSFPLGDFFELPDGPGGEADLEGLAFDSADHSLWMVGSHSLRRKQPDPGASGKAARRALAKVDSQANRYLLGRIKLDVSAQPPKPGKARALPFQDGGNDLTRLLARDELLKPFVALPSKDNGLDIEGLAVRNGTVLLGLRGPVLRGWASILQLRPMKDGESHLSLTPVEDERLFMHHLLDLGGLGIRDLCAWGDDLLILAGPTMVLDGPVRIYLLADGFSLDQGTCIDGGRLHLLLELPYGERCDHAEGMTVLQGFGGPDQLLVVYDSPAGGRSHYGRYYEADTFAIHR